MSCDTVFSGLIYMELKFLKETVMAPHSSTFAWKIPWTEEPGGLQSMGSLESDTTEQLHFHFSLSCIGEGNGNPLQCSCLENSRDGEAWWAAVYGVVQSRTRLKQLSSSSSRGYMPGFFKLSNIHLRLIHVFTQFDNSFLIIVKQYFMYCSMFIHSLIEGHLDYF